MINTEELILKLVSEPKSKEKGFSLLMDSYQKNVYHQIFALLKNHEDTKDVVQNTFIKVWKHIDGFKQNAKLSTWLYTIARNESLSFLNNKHQKNKSNLNEESKNLIFNQLKADSAIDEKEILDKLEQALELLPPLQKEVFLLRYQKEMKYAEMAKLLDSSESTLKSSYHFAVKKIESFLKEN